MSAACTMACSIRPCVSTRTCRFLPLIFLPASNPCRSIECPLFRAFHALAIDHRCCRAGLSPALLATFDVERVMDALERAVIAPAIEVVVHRAFRGQVLRQSAPLAAGAQDIHQTVHDLTDVDGPPVAAALGRRDL